MRNIAEKFFRRKSIGSLNCELNIAYHLSIVSDPGMTPSLASHSFSYSILLTLNEGVAG